MELWNIYWTNKKSFPRKHDKIVVYKKKDANKFNPLRDDDLESDANYKRWKKYFNSQSQICGNDYPKQDSKFQGYVERFKQEHCRFPNSKKDIILEINGKIMDDVWYIQSVNPVAKERIKYPTQKPELLLKRIIECCTSDGDLVLDFFAGSGTTPAVAEKLDRRWIAVDVGKYSIYTIQKRLLKLGDIKPFMLYSGGLYDAEKRNKFDNENWKLFALQLWNCRAKKSEVKGLKFDGQKDNCLVKVYSPQELQSSNLKISLETINEIDLIIGKNAGNEIFIIAPQGQFTFAEDEIETKNRIYHILRVPYSLLAKFT